jgi:molybdopterin-synthase adenylyltransferase
MFTKEELNRYNRQLILEGVGIDGQLKIKAARVLVVGAGGLGCPVLQYLAGAGVGTIGIVDFDNVEIHNLHRQILYATADIGKRKARVAAEKLKDLNPNCNFIVFDEKLVGENATRIIKQFDIIADGSDNFTTRYLVNDTCVKLGKPLVYGSIYNFEGQLAVFNYRGSKNLRDLYPEAPNPGDVPACSETGVLGIVPGMVGTMMCDKVLKIILDKFVDENILLVADFKRYCFRKINLGE